MTETNSSDNPQERQFEGDEVEETLRLPATREFWIKGNQVETITRIVMEYEESERGYWLDAVYVPDFDITRMNVSMSKMVHSLTIRRLLEDQEYTEVDHGEMQTTNLDDIHIMETDMGLI